MPHILEHLVVLLVHRTIQHGDLWHPVLLRDVHRMPGKVECLVLGQEELFLGDLLNPTGVSPSRANKYRAEAHQRLTWPLYGLLLPLLAVGMLSRGDFNRRGQWKVITSISSAAIILVVVVFGLNNFVARFPVLAPAIYMLAVGVLGVNIWILTRTRSIAPSAAHQQHFQTLLQSYPTSTKGGKV